MSNQQAKVIAGPHVLYTGTNGVKTAGITVESVLMDEAKCRADGRRFRWDVNTVSLQRDAVRDAFGITAAQQQKMIEECTALENG